MENEYKLVSWDTSTAGGVWEGGIQSVLLQIKNVVMRVWPHCCALAAPICNGSPGGTTG